MPSVTIVQKQLQKAIKDLAEKAAAHAVARNRVRFLSKMLQREQTKADRRVLRAASYECRACRYRREGRRGGPPHRNCPRARPTR